MEYDLIIKNGFIVDGSGNPGFKADLAVKGDKIVEIATNIGKEAAEIVDVTGKTVVPGFIDPHVHEELVEEFESTFDIPVMEVYGLTEAAGTTFDDVADRVTGSAGTPTKYSEMRIVDEDNGETVPVGELGEVILSGPTVFKEYRNNAAASKEALSGGWFYTGDIGYVDQEGRLYVRDRKKNIIIRGGQNIYPGEIEEILLSHPATQDAAVVGEPHEVYGEVVVAYVIAGLESGQELKSELTSLCEEELAEFKVPNDIHLKESLPRGETGKILKEKLS
mgnify:CR=1 FL=1